MSHFNIKKSQIRELAANFKEFAIRDGIVEMAIGIIVGSSFANVVSSLVKDIIMPPLGMLMGGFHLAHYKIILHPAVKNERGKIIEEAITFNIGKFGEAIIDFTIITISLFIVLRIINRLKKKRTLNFSPAKAEVPKEEQLLMDIKTILSTIEANTAKNNFDATQASIKSENTRNLSPQ